MSERRQAAWTVGGLLVVGLIVGGFALAENQQERAQEQEYEDAVSDLAKRMNGD